MEKRLFKSLPLGTRFRFSGQPRVWVVLERHGVGKVAEWEGPNASAKLQTICSVAGSEQELETLEVDVVDETPNDPK